jgi:predicted RNase H-like HicB family nuclease
MQTITLQHIIWKEDKHFVAQCLNIDVSSFGDTKEEAIKNLQEAVELYLEDDSDKNILHVEQPEIISSNFSYA